MSRTDVIATGVLAICMALPGHTVAKAIDYKASVDISAEPAQDASHVQGFVFEDLNKNGRFDLGERGLPNVMVSNGQEVILTDTLGHYQLPARAEMTVFVTKPAEYEVPVDENLLPQFFYHHQPNGSPPEIKRFGGLPPTGPLPAYQSLRKAPPFRAEI